MSIFGLSWIFKKQNIPEPDLTTPTEFINYARTFPEYQALCAVTDQESSDLSALSIYEMAVRGRAGIGATLPAANFRPELLADSLRNLLPLEMNIVARAKTDIDELLLDCFTNVGAALRSRADYIKQEHTYGAFAQESDFVKAAKYITSASNSISTAQAASQQTFIVSAMQNILNRDYDLRSLETLFHINSLFYDVNINMPFRRPHRNVRYPGSGGGYYLQKYTEQKARLLSANNTFINRDAIINQDDQKVVTPGIKLTLRHATNVNNNYTNIACFLFGAYLRAHGFSDGNGRTCRFIFACAMLKSGLPFVAPSKLFENRLTKLNPTQSELDHEYLEDLGIL